MKRREWHQIFQVGQQRVVDQARRDIFVTAVHDAMADAGKAAFGSDMVLEPLMEPEDCRFLIAPGHFPHVEQLAVTIRRAQTQGAADAFDLAVNAGTQRAIERGLEHREFDA